MEEETKRTNLLKKSINVFGRAVPVSVLVLLASSISAVAIATWILTQTTTITLAAFLTPTISEDMTITGMKIGEVKEKSIVISNPNEIPILSSSNWKVYVNGNKIGEGYTVNDIQEFALVKKITVTPTDKYGCDDGYCTNLVIPPKGSATFTVLYHIPQTYKYPSGTTNDLTATEVIQVKYEPTETQWTAPEFDGADTFVNPVCALYSWCV